MFATFVLSALASFFPAASGGEAQVTPVAGEAGDWVRVAHVRIEGSWFEIGRELAQLGSERHGSRPAKVQDAARTRAQRGYFAERYPAQLERMRGVAEYFGTELEKDELELDSVSYSAVSAGCTVVFYPPETTEDGRGVLSRNFDFTTGTWEGRPGKPRDPAVCSAPYLLELHPTVGYASLALVAFDLLGVVDGINSAGLTVALLADDELFATGQAHPSAGVQAGLEVLQVGRFLLDTCKDVAAAKAALRGSVFYYTSIPCHYLIADAAGHAFIWENAVDLAGGHVLEEEDGGPLVSTNYLRHLHPDLAELPEDGDPLGLFGRHQTLLGRFEEQGKFSRDEIRANATCVSARSRPNAGYAPGRTLWHALYFPAERRVEVDFYLGEGDGAHPDPRRSESFAFSIEPNR
jgi:hypothetical protein